jgi:hypothetical protein
MIIAAGRLWRNFWRRAENLRSCEPLHVPWRLSQYALSEYRGQRRSRYYERREKVSRCC